MARRARPVAFRDQLPAGGGGKFHLLRPAPGAGLRSALDAGAGATERGNLADLRRDRAKPGAGAVAVRHRRIILKRARTARPSSMSVSHYQADFRPAELFDAGPAGYDAMFSLEPGAGDGMPQRNLSAGRGADHRLDPDLRHQPIPSAARASRSRRWRRNFPTCAASSGKAMCVTPSRVSACPMWSRSSVSNSTPRARRLACREAYPVAERFLKALRIAGGQPSRPRMDISVRYCRSAGRAVCRFQLSPERRHHRQQRLSQTGRPRRHHRLFANPVSAGESPRFRPLAIVRQPATRPPTSCRPNAGYPWQDNFCEARSFEVGQCAGGFGHQGQDIRPGACPANGEGPEHCDPKQQGIVAVRDGVVIRSPKQQAATLQINTSTEHIRFRYMHMNPSSHGCRRRAERTPRRGRRKDRRGFELPRPSQRHHRATSISTSRCSRATAGSGSIPTSP